MLCDQLKPVDGTYRRLVQQMCKILQPLMQPSRYRLCDFHSAHSDNLEIQSKSKSFCNRPTAQEVISTVTDNLTSFRSYALMQANQYGFACESGSRVNFLGSFRKSLLLQVQDVQKLYLADILKLLRAFLDQLASHLRSTFMRYLNRAILSGFIHVHT